MIRDFDLFPEVSNLFTLERKYGAALNFEDQNGFRKKKKRVRKTAQPLEGGIKEMGTG
jgi:hypothetical protein